MAGKDHLDTETSVSAEITGSGLKASAKSRFIAAVDRLGGNIIDLINTPIEARNNQARTLADSRARMLEKVTEIALKKINEDPSLVDRAIEAQFQSILNRQANKDGVLAKAIEELRARPPSDAQAANGNPRLDESFLNPFERFAEDASTEDLREKWARILASEIREPGSVTPRFLRIVNEIDAFEAATFAELNEHRAAFVIPICLNKNVGWNKWSALEASGLIVPSIFGQVRKFTLISDISGMKVWTMLFNRFGLGFPASVSLGRLPHAETGHSAHPIEVFDDTPQIPVRIITDEGMTLTKLMEDNEEEVVLRLCQKISDAVGENIFIYERYNEEDWIVTRSVDPLSL